MKRLVQLSLLTLLAAAALGTASAPAFAGSTVSDLHRIGKSRSDSTNWSGYAAYDRVFTHVEGDWNVPTADCSQMKGNQLSIAAAFVGLDGYDSRTVEQAGTDSDCIGKEAFYVAWYEFYPERAIFLDENVYPVEPADHMHAEVTVTGDTARLTLQNVTADWTLTPAPERTSASFEFSSAEWILEAPSNKLTDFGSMTFFNASATSGSTTGDIDSFSPFDAIRMVKKGRRSNPTPRATPSALTIGGSAFSVDWNNY